MPYRFVPLGANAGIDEIRRAANANFAQLDGELVTKTYKQPGGNAIVEGKLPDGIGYGTAFYDRDNRLRILNGDLPYDGGIGILIYDSTPTPRILVGIAPDGEIDIAASISGEDITDLYT